MQFTQPALPFRILRHLQAQISSLWPDAPRRLLVAPVAVPASKAGPHSRGAQTGSCSAKNMDESIVISRDKRCHAMWWAGWADGRPKTANGHRGPAAFGSGSGQSAGSNGQMQRLESFHAAQVGLLFALSARFVG